MLEKFALKDGWKKANWKDIPKDEKLEEKIALKLKVLEEKRQRVLD